MRNSLLIITFFTTLSIFAQEIEVKKEVKDEIDFDAIDSLYREDQFYLNITYNALQKRIEGIAQNKLSPGIAFGFLRDMPINKSRTFAIATGLGYSLNIFDNNLQIINGENSLQPAGPSNKAISRNLIPRKFAFTGIETTCNLNGNIT